MKNEFELEKSVSYLDGALTFLAYSIKEFHIYYFSANLLELDENDLLGSYLVNSKKPFGYSEVKKEKNALKFLQNYFENIFQGKIRRCRACCLAFS